MDSLQRALFFYIFICGILFTGCFRTPCADDGFVSSIIADRTNTYVEWYRGVDINVQDLVEKILYEELTVEGAIQIALLNNPKIQETFEELGIAQADLVEAGLLSNPSFEIEIRCPPNKALRTNIEYLLTTNLLDLFLIPLRRKLATTEFEQTKLRVSNQILDLAFNIRETYYELITERKKIGYIKAIVELTSIISDISAKQSIIGNVNSLEFQLAQSRFFESTLELWQAQAEVIRLSEQFNRLLGLRADYCLILPEILPEELGYPGLDLCFLESIALGERLDVQIARLELVRLSQVLGLKNWWVYTNLKGGLAGEREPDGNNLIGPGFALEVPIFNYGQAARMRLFAQWRQAKERLLELEIRIQSEVREAHKLHMSYLGIINDYRSHLLPMQEKISASSEELYNVMGLGIDKLLENKRMEIIAFKNYIENFKRYLTSQVQLDRALGGFLFRSVMQNEYEEGERK